MRSLAKKDKRSNKQVVVPCKRSSPPCAPTDACLQLRNSAAVGCNMITSAKWPCRSAMWISQSEFWVNFMMMWILGGESLEGEFLRGLFLLENIGPKNSTPEFGPKIRDSKICIPEFDPKFGLTRCKIPSAETCPWDYISNSKTLKSVSASASVTIINSQTIKVYICNPENRQITDMVADIP